MPEIQEPTIAAIATPPGPGGIGIIRISGPKSLPILQKLFRSRKKTPQLKSHRLYYGWIISPTNAQPLDEVMAVYMKAPHTYTREDVVEIQCHGSFIILQDILAHIHQAGARPADPGEFTKLAFLNGRIDLTQAEAVIELLNAKTKTGLDLAMTQLQGKLHSEIESVRDIMVKMKAIIEVAIDFPEEDLDIINPQGRKQELSQEVIPVLEKLITASDKGQIFRDGISIVIVGRPNVGKSSLLNALLQKDRAIVTDIPGTTRDTIEEYLSINGMPIRIIDTAGVRNAEGSVEEIGIRKTKEKIANADMVLLVLDSSMPLQEEDHELYSSVQEKQVLIVANKQDVPGAQSLREEFKKFPMVNISAKKSEGIKGLEDAIFQQVTGDSSGWDPGHSSVPNSRHKSSLKKALSACNRLSEGLDFLPADLLAIELQSCLDYLGDIVGYTTTEDILDKIFADFCIGK